MASVTAFEAKTRFGKLLERVIQGEEVVITRHDKPIARLIPEGRPALSSIAGAVAGLRDLRRAINHRTAGRAKLTLAEVKSAIKKGRR